MNDILITDAQMTTWVSSFLWPFFRISSFFAIVPIFGSRSITYRVRIAFAFVITVLVAPLIPDVPDLIAPGLANYLVILEEMVFGLVMGFIVLGMVQVFVVAGQAISMQMGLGFASMLDPANGINVAVLSSWYLTMVSLMFIALNGHLVVFETLMDSFYLRPIGSGFFNEQTWMQLSNWGTWVFSASLSISLPAVVALLLINLTFGVMTRAAPQLNVFALGFPVTMICGIAIIFVTYSHILPLLREYLQTTLDFMDQMHDG